MREDLTTMILLNMALGTPLLENMEDESLYRVIMDPINSTILLREVMMATTLNIRTQSLPKT